MYTRKIFTTLIILIISQIASSQDITKSYDQDLDVSIAQLQKLNKLNSIEHLKKTISSLENLLNNSKNRSVDENTYLNNQHDALKLILKNVSKNSTCKLMKAELVVYFEPNATNMQPKSSYLQRPSKIIDHFCKFK